MKFDNEGKSSLSHFLVKPLFSISYNTTFSVQNNSFFLVTSLYNIYNTCLLHANISSIPYLSSMFYMIQIDAFKTLYPLFLSYLQFFFIHPQLPFHLHTLHISQNMKSILRPIPSLSSLCNSLINYFFLQKKHKFESHVSFTLLLVAFSSLFLVYLCTFSTYTLRQFNY